MVEAAKITGAKVSITGMLNYLNVSRSGFHAFLSVNHPAPKPIVLKLKVKYFKSIIGLFRTMERPKSRKN